MDTEEAQEQIAAIIERDTNTASSDAYEAAGGILTEVVRRLQKYAWQLGRESVAEQMMQPRDEYGMFPDVANPFDDEDDS